MKSEEKTIWQNIQGGDEVAFRALFDQHYASLCYVANRLVRNKDVAQDVAQDAFVELWSRREKLTIEHSIWGYLKRATINKSLNYIKAHKKVVSLDAVSVQKEVPQSKESYSDMERKELVQIVKNKINKLPEKCREVFVLRRYEELSYREIADLLQISERTVEVQLRKARLFLREELKPYKDFISIFLMLLMN